MSNAPLPEVPVDLRKIAEQSLEQIKFSIDGYLEFLQRAVLANVLGSSELGNKVFDYAQHNVTTAIEFAQKLVQVKDVHELASVQTEFVQAQMQAMTEQSKGLSDAAAKTFMNGTEILTRNKQLS